MIETRSLKRGLEPIADEVMQYHHSPVTMGTNWQRGWKMYVNLRTAISNITSVPTLSDLSPFGLLEDAVRRQKFALGPDRQFEFSFQNTKI